MGLATPFPLLPLSSPAAGMWGVCWAMPFNGNSLFAPLQQCQEVNEPHKGKSPLPRCQLGKLKMPPWLWGFLPARSPAQMLWGRRSGLGHEGGGGHMLCLMAPLLGSHPLPGLLWELLSVALPIHCEAHILSHVPAGKHHLHVLGRQTYLEPKHHSASAPDLRRVRWSAGRQVTSSA